jgi:mono/diheme cytochrome c family protein
MEKKMKTNLFNHHLKLAVSLLSLTVLLLVIPACSSSKSTSSTQPVSSTPLTGALANGQDIFQNGLDTSGVYIAAQGHTSTTTLNFTCAECHGIQGQGGVGPNITWTELTGPDNVPPYTVATLEQAITQGLDQNGNSLETTMPRFSMSSQDLDDFVSYIQTLK